MDNRILFGIMCILFNCYGVPSFMQGQTKTGIMRIVLCVVTCGILGCVNMVMGIIMGIKILCMSDEEFAAKKNEMFMGIPAVKFDAAPEAEKTEETEE